MDDVPDQARPSVIADEASSRSKAGTAAIGFACLRWTKAAAARSRGAPFKRYGPSAALTAGLFGLACLGWSDIQRLPPTPPRAEINLPAQKTAEESNAQRAEVEATHAAQILNAKEVSAPQPAKPSSWRREGRSQPWHCRGRAQDQPLTAQNHGEACQRKRQDRSNWIEDRDAARCRSSRRSLSTRNAGAKTGTKSSPRRLRSIATSQRTGRSPLARNHSIDGASKQGERRLRIRATGRLIASFGHAGEAQAKLGATLVAQKVQWSLVKPSHNRALTQSGMRNS